MSFVRSAAADEFAAAYQSECAAEGRYGALKTIPAVPAAEESEDSPRRAAECRGEKKRVQGSGVWPRRFPEPRTRNPGSRTPAPIVDFTAIGENPGMKNLEAGE